MLSDIIFCLCCSRPVSKSFLFVYAPLSSCVSFRSPPIIFYLMFLLCLPYTIITVSKTKSRRTRNLKDAYFTSVYMRAIIAVDKQSSYSTSHGCLHPPSRNRTLSTIHINTPRRIFARYVSCNFWSNWFRTCDVSIGEDLVKEGNSKHERRLTCIRFGAAYFASPFEILCDNDA